MVGPSDPRFLSIKTLSAGSPPASSRLPGTTRRTAIGLVLGAPLLAACSGVQQRLSSFSNPFSSTGPARPPQQPEAGGNGGVKVGLILPLSAAGNAGVAAQSMKNAAEMALAEFQNPNIQLLIKDDGGSPQGAQQGTQQALDEGAESILGPLFELSGAAASRPRNTGATAREWRVWHRRSARPMRCFWPTTAIQWWRRPTR